MKPHLIAIDLDGTLLTDNKIITDRTLKTIKEVRERGHIVMISTGRPFRASQIYYQQMQLDTPIVNFNGAHVHHPINPKWGNYHSPMELDVAKQIIETCSRYNIQNILAEIKDDVYIHYYDETIMEIVSMGNPLIQTGSLTDTLKYDPTSILIHPTEEEVESIRKNLSNELGNLIDHRKWGAPWHVIEVVKSGINKAVGVSKVADSFNIPTERIIAFGDEDNDLEMLDFAGYGVAMGNAIEEVKSVANEITKTNEEDGLAQFLEEFFDI